MPSRCWGDAPVEDLERVLATQIEAVDRRVGRSGPYSHESDEIRRAADAVRSLSGQLGLGRFIRSLTPPTGKPQYLLVFDDGAGVPIVLKVYGRVTPAEGAVQRRWTERNVGCVPTIRDGNDPVSWLIMSFLEAAPLTTSRERDWDLEEVTRFLAVFAARAHELPPPDPSVCRPLRAGVLHHLRAVTAVLQQHGYPLPGAWDRWAPAVYDDGIRATLHGDLFPGNVLRDARSGQLHVIDARGYLGDPAFDMARWAVRAAAPDRFDEIHAIWSSHEALSSRVASGMLAAEALMQAGVRELVKRERGHDVRFDLCTQLLLDAVPGLLSAWEEGGP